MVIQLLYRKPGVLFVFPFLPLSLSLTHNLSNLFIGGFSMLAIRRMKKKFSAVLIGRVIRFPNCNAQMPT